jgi:hypothetical protein
MGRRDERVAAPQRGTVALGLGAERVRHRDRVGDRLTGDHQIIADTLDRHGQDPRVGLDLRRRVAHARAAMQNRDPEPVDHAIAELRRAQDQRRL